MDCQGKNFLKFVLLICAIAYGSFAYSGSNGEQAEPYCSVSEKYLEKHGELNQESYHLNKDFSCLTDLATLRDDLSSYQKIDIRTSSRSFDEIDDAWRMTVRELQSSRALRDRSLLLLDNGFSRVNAAKDCASLKKSGYTDVKILVGGVDTWRAENQQRYRNSFGAPKTVTARQFLHEYFNGNLVLIAENEQLAHELASLGLSEKPHVADTGGLSVSEIIADRSGGGYYPVVYIGSMSSIPIEHPERINNLYFVEGSTGAIAFEIAQSRWINANRTDIPRRYRCG